MRRIIVYHIFILAFLAAPVLSEISYRGFQRHIAQTPAKDVTNIDRFKLEQHEKSEGSLLIISITTTAVLFFFFLKTGGYSITEQDEIDDAVPLLEVLNKPKF